MRWRSQRKEDNLINQLLFLDTLAEIKENLKDKRMFLECLRVTNNLERKQKVGLDKVLGWS